MKVKPFILFGLSVVLLFAAAAYAMSIKVKTTDNSGIYTTRLIAGQHTDIGEVIVQADNTFLYIQYQIDLDNEYTLFNTHLWAGQDLAEMPVNRKGNPALGKFPYTATQLDTKSWVQQISLYSLGLTVEDICLEDVAVLFAAHASVVMYGDGIVTAQETAWANGEQINEGGSWAMYDEFILTCDHGEEVECETSWAFGDFEFDDYLPTERWGWFYEIEKESCEWHEQPIYMAAGQNDPSKGTEIGLIWYGYNRGSFEAFMFVYPEYQSDYKLVDAHLYASYEMPNTAAPGQFGQTSWADGHNRPDWNDGRGVYFRSPRPYFDGSPIFVAFHAEICPRDK